MAWMVNDYPEPKDEPPVPVCPVCGRECEHLYIRRVDGEVLGCDLCGEWVYASDME